MLVAYFELNVLGSNPARAYFSGIISLERKFGQHPRERAFASGGRTTTGLTFFAECLRHLAKAILHSTKLLLSVTLDKEYSANILSGKGSLPITFLDTRQKSTRQIKNRKKPQKTAKHFLIYRDNSPTA